MICWHTWQLCQVILVIRKYKKNDMRCTKMKHTDEYALNAMHWSRQTVVVMLFWYYSNDLNEWFYELWRRFLVYPPPSSVRSVRSLKNNYETRNAFHPYDLSQFINVQTYHTWYDFQLRCKYLWKNSNFLMLWNAH